MFTVLLFICFFLFFFFFNDTATTEIYTLSLHDALPIYRGLRAAGAGGGARGVGRRHPHARRQRVWVAPPQRLRRSEEHTSELQSQSNLVCRLLLEKKKKKKIKKKNNPVNDHHRTLVLFF